MTKILPAVAAVGALVLLAGCAQKLWTKPGLTQQGFNTDKYACERDSRQSGGFGGGLAGAIEQAEFFDRCMVAHGYEIQGTAPTQRQLAAQQNNNSIKRIIEDMKNCIVSIRQKPVYQAIYSKTNQEDGNGNKYSIRQMSDNSNISNAEISIMTAYISDGEVCRSKEVTDLAPLNPKLSEATRELFDDTRQIYAKLIRKEISWGRFTSEIEANGMTLKKRYDAKGGT